jgi:hypothetical protein
MNELDEKCKLLEKSLRILAQENHDLENKTNYDDQLMYNIYPNDDTEPCGDDRIADEDNSDEEFYDIGIVHFKLNEPYLRAHTHRHCKLPPKFKQQMKGICFQINQTYKTQRTNFVRNNLK